MAFGPADAAAALKALLTPNGTPVGTLRAVLDRSPELPYTGLTPALFLYPDEFLEDYLGARSKRIAGYLALTYLDSTPTVQGATLATIEDAMWVNHQAVITAIRSDLSWGQKVTAGGDRIEGKSNPDGPMRDEAGTWWTSWRLRVYYRGPTEYV